MRFYKAVDLSKIRVLSFDLDNTIYDCQSVLTRAENWLTDYLCEKFSLGGECKEYAFWAKIKAELLRENNELANDVGYLRALSLVEAFRRLKMPLKGGIDEAMEYVDLFVSHRSDGYVSPQVHDLMGRLCSRYRLIAVSNGNLDARRLGVSHYFEYDVRPRMHELKCKPHQDMFCRAIELMGVTKDEVLHVGDDPYTDVYGAVSNGIACAWVYKGYTKNLSDETQLRILPQIALDDVLELETLLLDKHSSIKR